VSPASGTKPPRPIDEVLIEHGLFETRVALIADGRVVELLLDRADRPGRLGNIYLGRVTRVVPGMQAAFVDIGAGQAGFLGVREAQALVGTTRAAGKEMSAPIEACVQEGQAVLVQAIKEPIGDKGMRLSANPTLPGRYLAFAPRGTGSRVSRHIADEGERARLAALLAGIAGEGEGGAFVARTKAAGVDADGLAAEATALRAAWRALEARRKSARVPACLYEEPDAAVRALRDHAGDEIRRVRVDAADGLARLRAYCARFAPALGDRLELHGAEAPLFDLYGVEDDIEAALEPRVPLPSGGFLTIEGTEALTAVDVDSGRFVDPGGAAETGLRTNLEAAEATARQLRLRGIGGIVVIDFIHAAGAGHARRLLDALEAALADDPAPTRVIGMSELGLVEMTRKRTGEPLANLMSEACPGCRGAGRVPTVAATAARIERRAAREARAARGGRLIVEAAPEVAAWLAEKGRRGALECRLGRTLAVIGVEGRGREAFEVRPG